MLNEAIPALMTIKRAAEICGISRTTMSKIVNANPESYVPGGSGNSKMVKRDWIMSYIGDDGKRHEITGEEERLVAPR